MNYFQRLDRYRKLNYFQVNGNMLDVYVPTLPQWSQNLDVVKDILTYSDDIDIADEFDILTIRLTGKEITSEELTAFESTLATANQVLGETTPNELWETMKPEGGASKMYLAIVFDHQTKKTNESKDPTIVKRSRTVRVIPSDPEPV